MNTDALWSSFIRAALLVCSAGAAAEAGTVIYVRAGYAGDGSSWGSATTLPSALSRAVAGDQIWVAAGTYKPTTTADRTVSFAMRNGVAVYGGFPAGGNPVWSDRNPGAHVTTLSGDLLGDDGPDFANTADNSYAVVTGQSVNSTAALDGFTITGGEADVQDSQPTHGSSGGAVFLTGGSPTIRNCTFLRNRAWIGGGAIAAVNSSPAIFRCRFEANHVRGGAGGALLNYSGGNGSLTECVFVGNSATSYGGALYNGIARARVLNCGFYGNFSETSGGAVYEIYGPSSFMSCVFSGNRAQSRTTPPTDTYGGAIVTQMSAPKLTNCTFWRNTATYGGGVVNAASMTTWPTLVNCILWDNPGGEILAHMGQSPDVLYSDVMHGAPGLANINLDPRFADADGADGLVGTPDDNLHLLPDSPCIDTGRNADVPADVLTDLMGTARLLDNPSTPDCPPGGCGPAPIVDLGAYEFIAIPCDADHDADVDGDDFAEFRLCAAGPAIERAGDCARWDFDQDNDVDMDDYGVFQRCHSGAGIPGNPGCP